MKSAQSEALTITVAKRRLTRKAAIFLAVLIMWFISSIGLALLHSESWHFFQLEGHDSGTLVQIGGYYLARTAAQLPAFALAAIIIGHSAFRRPARAACITALTYCGIMSLVRLARDPWAGAPNLDQSIPILGEAAQLVLLVAFAGFFTRLFVSISACLKQVLWLDIRIAEV